MGTVRISDRLHNQGLEALRNGDLCRGIQALTKSVAINKNNVPSRNLLGLALFEVGHVGEAIKHWVISQSLLQEDNAAVKYLDTTSKNARQLEKLNDATDMYNQALSHIKQKSEDLAIIQLKKAIDINPKFVDAGNLLTLCYMITNDKTLANSTVEKVLAVDALNSIALNYYSGLNPEKRIPRPTMQKSKPLTANNAPYRALGLEDKKERNFHLPELLTFIIGAAISFAACYFLLVPAIQSGFETERQVAADAAIDARIEFHEERTELEARIAELQLDVSTHEFQHDVAAQELAFERRINQVNNAYMHFRAVDAAATDENLAALRNITDTLAEITITDLPPDIIDRANTIIDEAHPRIGVGYYTAGRNSFNPPRDSYMALQHLENAHRFLTPEAAQWNRVLFMLGSLYYADDNFDDAYEMLSELRERAPNLPSPFTGTERQHFNNMIAGIEGQR
jgi:tetratricopeptide (TPR) repeat protein